ncbi:glycosyltransferase family 4 protein [Halothece sp. PCC 7418]|uniref:glycosyltransferase family 4 protein n=1 Tax=Halothece sp. (strain PCC 7418) TaxID=65093 RepID=UPI0002E12307|nr:glycosyltransferase family 4 protein [Halothece sp. PCC 7418]
MISAILPSPYTPNSIPTRTFNLMKYLNERHEVTLVAQHDQMAKDDQIDTLGKWVEDLVIFPHHYEMGRRGIMNRAKRLGQFLKEGTPNSVLSYYSPQMQQWIDEKVAEESFDVITCEHSINEIYVRPEWQKQIRTIANIHGSMYGTCQKYLERQTTAKKKLREQLNLPLLKRYEQQYCSKFSALVTTTTEDKQQIKALQTEKSITVIPNGVDLNLFSKRVRDLGGYQLLYVSHQEELAVTEEVNFLCESVFPELKSRYPEIMLTLLGIPNQLHHWGEVSGIRIADKRSSLQTLLQQTTVCVCPTQAGLGMKLAPLRAMAVGVPVVGSDRALEGLNVDGKTVNLAAMRANRLEEYIYAIGRLLQDPQLRQRLSQNARHLVEKNHDWRKLTEQYEKVLMANVNYPATTRSLS